MIIHDYCDYQRIFNENEYVPDICDAVTHSLLDNPVQDIVTYICNCTFHPLDLDGALAYVKIILEELGFRTRFPVKVLSDLAPEPFWVLDGPLVHFLVHIETGDMGIFLEFVARIIDQRFVTVLRNGHC